MKSELLKKLCKYRADRLVEQRAALVNSSATVEGTCNGRPSGRKYKMQLSEGGDEVVAIEAGEPIEIGSIFVAIDATTRRLRKIRKLSQKIEYWREKELNF